MKDAYDLGRALHVTRIAQIWQVMCVGENVFDDQIEAVQARKPGGD